MPGPTGRRRVRRRRKCRLPRVAVRCAACAQAAEGNALNAKPRENVSYLKALLALNRYLIPYWPLQSLVLLVVLIASLTELASPLLAKVMIDEAFGKRDLFLFHVLLLIGLLLFVFQGGFSVLQQYVSAYIGRLLTFDLRRDYTRHFFRLSFLDAHRRPTGEQIYRIGPDIDAVSTLATDSIPEILRAAARLFFLSAVCLYLSWKLTLLTFLLAPLFYLQARYFGRRQQGITQRVTQKSQDTLAALQDTFANLRLVKAFHRERWAVRRYLRDRITLIRLGLEQVRLVVAANLSASLFTTLALTAFTYYIGRHVIEARVTLGILVALVLYLGQLFGTVRALGLLYRRVMTRFVAWDRVQETFAAACRADGVEPAPRPLGGAIRFERVSFGYEPGQAVLREVDLAIGAGQFAALVGASGSGKTTLLMLLLRVVDPWHGRILIDGRDIRRLAWRSVAPQVGIALQEGLLLNASVAENLRFGRLTATQQEMWQALEVADLAPVVRQLDRGLETPVGEGGSRLSEGQRQRLSIARAVIGRPRILVLDEATSSVGFDSESRILANIRDYLPGSTLIIASHRLSSIRNADLIGVLDGGALIETGRHAELMARGGPYSVLYGQQAAKLEADVRA
ncbi:MAG: ABC transporter ATP-binding protein [Kiritimatiellae bacterium]|nr:ABC transporter ATP-binding protein [Kiritimatiellia bacterium]